MMAGEWRSQRIESGLAPGLDEDRLPWRGAIAFREERGRKRRRLRAVLLIGLFFCYGLLQVRVATRVASAGSHVTQLQREVTRLQEDLAIEKSRLASRQIYGQLLAPAQRAGFGPGAQYRVIVVPETPTAPAPSLVDQAAAELQRGSKLILPEALAQDLWPEGRSRASRQ